MTRAFTTLAYSDGVKAAQTRYGTRQHSARMAQRDPANDALTPEIIDFIAARDSFFIASSSRDGWPHVQHRGGPKGFLKVLDPTTLAFGDFDGNKQFITLGNLIENDRVCLFLPDYAAGRRMKLWGHARIADDRPDLLDQVSDASYPTPVKRVVVIGVAAWDFNCRQHIRRRLDEDEVKAVVEKEREELLEFLLAPAG
jgi:predicted pyridoxine 5'-phosphate oxidase superfamily flavin-nucleotide-binding protein